MFFRNVAIRILLPLFWRPSPKRTSAGLERFAITETDSVWQILLTLKAVSDPKVRAKVFQHALEEAHHASEFTRVAAGICAVPPHRPRPERIPIYDESRGDQALADFMAYAHVGEQDVFDQFSSYAAGVGLPEAAAVFHEAKKDERGHAALTLHFLKGLLPSPRAVRMRIVKTRFRRAYEGWLRFSKNIGEGPMTLLLSLSYLGAGLLAAPSCARTLWGKSEQDAGELLTHRVEEQA